MTSIDRGPQSRPPEDWSAPRPLARGLRVSRLALASSYGAGAREVARAFERGVNFFVWGALRRRDFGAGLRALARRDRDRVVIAVQSFAQPPLAVRLSVEEARLRLGVDALDVLCLGYRRAPVARALWDACVALRESGRVRALMVACHDRPTFATLGAFDAWMVRYNAAHTGAEREVFPLAAPAGPAVAAYTATRWGTLLDPATLPPDEPPPRASDCYRFALSHPAVTTCLAGPADAAELDEALAALERGPLSADERAWMARVGARVRETRANAPPLGARDYARHGVAMARDVLRRGITEQLLSRFAR